MIEKKYDHNFEETAAAWDELPKLKADLEAVGADQSLDEKEKWCGCRPSFLVPAGEKTKRMETDHLKTGSEPNNVRLCSLMFAYVRLIGKKFVAAPILISDASALGSPLKKRAVAALVERRPVYWPGCIKLLDFSLCSIGWRRGLGRGGAFLLVSPLLGPLPTRSSRGEDGELDAALVCW